MNNKNLVRFLRASAVILITSVLFIGIVRVVKAVLYEISVTDGTVEEWSSQSIPVFQTDDTGETGINPEVDIVQAWAASGYETGTSTPALFFRMETNTETALGPDLAAIASIDCDNNGVFNDPGDRLIVYTPECGIFGPAMIFARGDQSFAVNAGLEGAQRVGSDVEWRVPLANLPPNELDPDVDCRGTVGLKFYTANVHLYCIQPPTGPAEMIDETNGSPFTGIDIPSAVEMHSFEVSADYRTVLPGLLVLVVVTGIAMSGIILVNKLLVKQNSRK